VVVGLDVDHHHAVEQGAIECGHLVTAVRGVDRHHHLVLRVQGMGVEATQLSFGRRFDKLEDRLQGILLLGPVQFVAVDYRLRVVIKRPPGGA